jgi:hypothetical protein
MKQVDLFGQTTTRRAHFYVFHDESEPKVNTGWLLIGLLFVKETDLSTVRDELRYHRQQEKYCGEVHFSDLPKNFGGAFGAKARVAERWLQAYQHGLCKYALFTCLAVNRASPKFEHKRFSQDYHAYNRFTAMAIKAGVSYMLAPMGLDEIQLTVKSDAKDRKSRPDRGLVDNFEDYIPYRVELDNFHARESRYGAYPKVFVTDVCPADSKKSDLLQLTDLLLGATQAALTGGAHRPTKLKLGTMIVSWYEDLQKPPWDQKLGMHRKFNLWGFPDDDGGPFNKFSMSLATNEQQPSLF